MEERCSDCVFWRSMGVDEDSPLHLGTCHRFPPVVFVKDADRMGDIWMFPETNENQWCGEFKPKQPEPVTMAPRLAGEMKPRRKA